MKSPQLSTALSLVALGLAVASIAMQIDWSREDQATAISTSTMAGDPPQTGALAVPPAASANAATPTATGEETAQGPDADQLAEKVAHLEQQLYGLRRLVQASGLDLAVPMWDTHPGGAGPVFEQLGKEAAGRAQFDARREELSQKASEARDNDYTRYGADRYRQLEELYRSARPSRTSNTEQDRATRTEALNRMVDEFPDAYETGVAVAEQALHEALDGNTEQVEAHLRTLSETSSYTGIITEQGMEAVPTIQTFLARKYIEQDRVEDASVLLNQLSQNYPDSLIVEPGPGNSPTAPRTALEVATELRQQLGDDPDASSQ